jgi:hypothetical protein
VGYGGHGEEEVLLSLHRRLRPGSFTFLMPICSGSALSARESADGTIDELGEVDGLGERGLYTGAVQLKAYDLGDAQRAPKSAR